MKVYGRFPTDGVSSGRPHYLGDTALGNRSAELYPAARPSWHCLQLSPERRLFRQPRVDTPLAETVTALLARLGDMGVRRVTVSTPFLLELVKTPFPEFKVRVGIYAQVDTPRRARFWEDLGADAIVLESFSIQPELSPPGGHPPSGPLRSGTDCESRLPHELSDANLSSETVFAHCL